MENGKLALIAAMKTPYDLIFMDMQMQMPVMDGMRAVRLLRDKGYAKPIVALTANAMAEDKQICLSAGCDDFVTKPINRQQLSEVVQRYLKPRDNQPHDLSPIISTIMEEEPEFADIVERYVEELPKVNERLFAFIKKAEWEELKKEVHNIKGCGGNFGFPNLTEIASEMELQILNKNQKELSDLMQKFDTLSQRIYLGHKSENQSS